MSTVSQLVRDSTGKLYPDIVDVSRQLSGTGAPDPSLGSNGNTYTDTSNSRVYQKQNGEWVDVLNLRDAVTGISGGSIVTNGANLAGTGIFQFVDVSGTMLFKGLEAGTNITIDPQVDKVIINSTASGGLTGATNLGNGENVFAGESPLGNLNFKTITAGGSVNLSGSAGELQISSSGQANSGYNVGLPSASQVYKGMNGALFQFKCLYSSNTDLMNMADDVGGNNIVLSPKLAVAHSNVIQNIGTIGLHYWGAASVSPSNTDAIVINSSLTRLYRITAKILNDSLWSISSGEVNLQVGYYGSGQIVNDGNFIVITTIPLPVGTQNFDITYTFPPFTNLPPLGAVSVRVQNVSGVTSTNQADMSVSLVVIDV